MKTTSKVFSAIFLALGICAALAALGGATHQWFVAILCFVISSVLAAETIEQTEP